MLVMEGLLHQNVTDVDNIGSGWIVWRTGVTLGLVNLSVGFSSGSICSRFARRAARSAMDDLPRPNEVTVLGNIITSDLAVRLTYITVSRYVNQAI